jgi:recombination protein RecT
MAEPANEQPRELAPLTVVRQALTKMAPEFKMALPAHITPERFIRTAQTAISLNPDILACDRKSLFSACMKAAQDGLILDGREAALVKFGTAAQYMPMVAGLLKKARNSGEIASIDAQIVHAADKFTYRPGVDAAPIHEPDWFGVRGEIVGAYAVAKTKDNATYVEIMSRPQIEKVRSTSRAKGGGPWTQWWDEMARKTVIRRLSKRLPSSADRDNDEFQRAVERDDEMYDATHSASDTATAETVITLDAALAQEAPAVIEPEAPAVDLDAILETARGWHGKFKAAKTQAAVDELLADPDWREHRLVLEQHAAQALAEISKHFTKES